MREVVSEFHRSRGKRPVVARSERAAEKSAFQSVERAAKGRRIGTESMQAGGQRKLAVQMRIRRTASVNAEIGADAQHRTAELATLAAAGYFLPTSALRRRFAFECRADAAFDRRGRGRRRIRASARVPASPSRGLARRRMRV